MRDYTVKEHVQKFKQRKVVDFGFVLLSLLLVLCLFGLHFETQQDRKKFQSAGSLL